MNYEYKLSAIEKGVLAGCIGKTLSSYLKTDDDYDLSFEMFVLRFDHTDVEIRTKEIVQISEWFDETNTMEVINRPKRDSVSSLADRLPNGKLRRTTLIETQVKKIVRGISLAINTMTWTDENPGFGEYVRGIVIHLDDEDIVFDKGPLGWEDIWRMCRCAKGSYEFTTDYDPETPQVKTTVRVVDAC